MMIGISTGSFKAISKRNGTQIVLYDTFDRADNTVLGTATSGQSWTTTTYGIIGNQAYRSSGAGPFATIPSGTSDGYLQFRETALTEAGIFQGVLFRYVDLNNYLRLVLQDGTLFIQKREASVTTTIASKAITRTENSLYMIGYLGSSIIVYLNGVPIITTSSSFNTTATIVGFIGSTTTTGRMDDFYVWSR